MKLRIMREPPDIGDEPGGGEVLHDEEFGGPGADR